MSEEMKELVTVESTPASLSANFDEVRQAIEQRLAQYDVIVTADGVKDAKALATEINKLAQEIDRRRKDEVAKVSEPIKAFDQQMKELRDLCKERRQKLLDQVQQFEDQAREELIKLLQSHVESLWQRDGVEQRFRRATTDDLVKLSNLTGGGKLAKAAKEAIEERVRADRNLQEKVRTRLLELEARSFRAGLAAPLTEDHVYRFLEADDDDYEWELQRLLGAEIARQEEAEQRTRERVEKERAQTAPEQPAEAAPSEPEPSAPEVEAPAGKVALRVSCDFDITVAAHVTDEEVEAELRRILAKAGITTLAAVRIHRGAKSTEAA